MSVNNTDEELVSTRSLIETANTSSQTDTATLFSSSYAPRTASTSALYPSYTLPATLTPTYKSNKRIE